MNNKHRSPRIKTHDEFFKNAMSRPKVAKEFFSEYLPAHVLKLIDLDTLYLEKGIFCDKVLGPAIADMLFSVKFCREIGYFYLLCEQQTTPDHLMAFRIIKYMLRICDDHLQRYPDSVKLPLVYPIIFHNGKGKYTAARDLWSLFTDPERAKLFFSSEIQLIELQRLADKDLLKRLWSGSMQYVMKHIFDQDIVPAIKQIQSLLQKVGIDDYFYLEAISWYIMERAESTSAQEAFGLLREVIPEERREGFMTILESLQKDWLEKGKQSGLLEGIEKGRYIGLTEGIERSREEIARKLLIKGTSLADISEITGLSHTALQKLLK